MLSLIFLILIPRKLDLSYNKIAHLDLSLLEDSPLQKLLLVANEIYLISGSTKVCFWNLSGQLLFKNPVEG